MKEPFRLYVYWIIIFVAVLSTSCKESNEKTEEKNSVSFDLIAAPLLNMDSLRRVIRKEVREEEVKQIFTNVDPEQNPFTIGGIRKVNCTFFEQTKIYELPDTTSNVVSVLPFATSVIFLEGIKEKALKGIVWIKIQNPLDKTKTAYINKADLADYISHTYTPEDKEQILLISQIAVSEKEGYRAVEIRRCNKGEHTILEKYRTGYMSSGYRFTEAHSVTLKGKNKNSGMIFVYETFRQSCPGGGMKEFIIDDGKKLSKIVSVASEGEGGYFDMTEAYIPMKFGEKILLVADADLPNIFNMQNGTLNTIPYSSAYNVPVENIVIVKHSENGYETTADYDVDPSTVKVNVVLTIYEWTGTKLIKKNTITEK